MSRAAFTRSMYRAAMLLAANGGLLSDLTTDNVVEMIDTEAEIQGKTVGATNLFYRLLRDMGVFGPTAPMTYRQLRTRGQRTPEQIIDRYHLRNGPIRDLLVDYLRERQPSLDYTSLESLAAQLAGLFWSDIERHHPKITTLDLPRSVADAWKMRLRTVTKIIRDPDGNRRRVDTLRINYRECLTPVRAFYLDLAHWAVEDPARWAAWVAPSPVGAEEVDRRKDKRRRKSRMDSRTRDRLPVLPVLVKTVNQRRISAAAALQAALTTQPGHTFTLGEQQLRRVTLRRSAASRVWVEDASGRRRDLAHEEEYAFWGWATVEILRETGIRIEELSELSHHSLVQYRVPTSGEVVPLLQIAPSKTDAERLLVVSPELADVLAQIIHRVRAADGTIPAVGAYDPRERTWQSATPLLFQRRYGHERRAITISTLRQMLNAALDATGLTESTGEPLRFTPHDFRRLFITDAILNGLPPHIAQVIAGHSDINTTIGYNTIYPDDTIRAHRAFLARRRSLRPSEEYRTPTQAEWEEFLGHFQRRKVSLGTCARSFGTPCIHEHACVRCPMLWPDPAQRSRLAEIIDNLTDRIAEAEKEGWHGEIEGLQISKASAIDKLAQLDQRGGPVQLGMPTATRAPTEMTPCGSQP